MKTKPNTYADLINILPRTGKLMGAYTALAEQFNMSVYQTFCTLSNLQHLGYVKIYRDPNTHNAVYQFTEKVDSGEAGILNSEIKLFEKLRKVNFL